ncbi:MAG: hypothetical protein [Microvirus sp.]|nr:MAG: hypothetical protein [Microvirus sp.]
MSKYTQPAGQTRQNIRAAGQSHPMNSPNKHKRGGRGNI